MVSVDAAGAGVGDEQQVVAHGDVVARGGEFFLKQQYIKIY